LENNNSVNPYTNIKYYAIPTLCIARDSSDWHPMGSSTYEQAPTFLFIKRIPELNGLFLSPKFHQGLSVIK
jgi:hypothetical protein